MDLLYEESMGKLWYGLNKKETVVGTPEVFSVFGAFRSINVIRGPNGNQVPQSKYAELLAIIEELGKEIRPTYAGSKSAMERLKRGIIHARGLVRECLAETERNARS
ncbi:hypothetical protein cypCar_00001763 [Cyprinus carpio]|nr:hypothetical protein cypCar_00001763 [Cyprinus carpio]